MPRGIYKRKQKREQSTGMLATEIKEKARESLQDQVMEGFIDALTAEQAKSILKKILVKA